MIRSLVTVTLLLLAFPAGAADYILPVFALYVPGEGGSLWTSEVWVTNPGPDLVRVYEENLIGRTIGAPPCLPLVQPSITVEPHSTRHWPATHLSVGIGCPESAAGALRFRSEGPVQIASRIVNTRGDASPPTGLLQGFGQEVVASLDRELPDSFLILPGIVWHANACGPRAFDTNVFFANSGAAPVRVSMQLQAGSGEELLVDGNVVKAPFVFTVGPNEFLQHRIGAPDSPLTVCLPPMVGALSLELDGPLSILGSVVDRSTGDARTVPPLEVPR